MPLLSLSCLRYVGDSATINNPQDFGTKLALPHDARWRNAVNSKWKSCFVVALVLAAVVVIPILGEKLYDALDQDQLNTIQSASNH